MTLKLVFSPESREHLAELFRYIARERSVEVAAGYTDAIVESCEQLASFPLRGRQRDDVGAGIRTVGFRRRVLIAFSVRGETVTIIAIYYGGQDAEARLAALRHLRG